MADPYEGIAPGGTIRTGARRDRVPPRFEGVIGDAVAAIDHTGTSLYLYGSVANGTARPGSSDVDLLSIDLPNAAALATRLSQAFADLCRGVEIAAATAEDFVGDTDEAYGNRVFLRHYCVHLAGPDRAAALPAFRADVRAARGFNGDLDQLLRRWREHLRSGESPVETLGVRIARRTLLATAGLVSVHDGAWTTDRSLAARRWSQIEPGLGPGLALLESWTSGTVGPTRREVETVLAATGLVPAVVARFNDLIGLWPDPRQVR